MMLWFNVWFNWVHCERQATCSTPAYIRARDVTWKLLECAVLFTVANVLKVFRPRR
jgi:hypothetical protein